MNWTALKADQSLVWSSAPYERIAATLCDVYDRVLARLTPRPGERALDVACGTGELARKAARLGADVTGVDLAPGMVDTARRAAAAEGLRIRFDVADAESLPYEDGSFDLVVSTVGIIFTPDHQASAGEVRRVCRHGGRLGLANWDPSSGVARQFEVMARFQAPPPSGAGDPFDWGRRAHVRRLLEDEFSLQFHDEDAPYTTESAQAVWELRTAAYGPVKALVESLDPGRRAELRRAWLDLFEGYRVCGGVRQPRRYLLVLGRRR